MNPIYGKRQYDVYNTFKLIALSMITGDILLPVRARTLVLVEATCTVCTTALHPLAESNKVKQLSL